LEKLFRSKLEAAPEDQALLERAFGLMSRAKDCGENEFYIEVAEKQHAVKPSAATADFLANVFQNRGDNQKALKYINDVLGNTTDPIELSKLYSRIAGLEIAQNNYSEAAKAAKTAREHNPENGLAYFFLAQAYAATTGGCQGIDKNAVYWAAYDLMSQASKLMEADTEMQNIVEVANKMMGAYRGGFPTAEDGFFNDLKAGQGYTVKCGLAAGTSTTVRFK
jgi:tetratricopeptide (TPR) repeat protein